MRLTAAAALIATTLAAQAARADPPCPTPPIATPAPDVEPVDGKSGTTALLLSLGGTAAGVGLLALLDTRTLRNAGAWGDAVALTGLATIALGPSFGQWYAGRGWTRGLTLRAGGALLAVIGLGVQLGSCGIDSEGCDPVVGGVIFLGGGAIFLGGGVWDIATAPGAAQDWNRAHAHDVTVVPTMMRDARGDETPGLALVGSF